MVEESWVSLAENREIAGLIRARLFVGTARAGVNNHEEEVVLCYSELGTVSSCPRSVPAAPAKGG